MEGFDLLRRQGILFARRGGAPEYDYDSGRGVAYEPGLDHPLLIPSAGDSRPRWTIDGTQRHLELPAREWDRSQPGEYRVRRELPNQVAFGATARFDDRSLRIELFVENHSRETLRGLDVQNCVMLHGCPDFDSVAPERLIAALTAVW